MPVSPEVMELGDDAMGADDGKECADSAASVPAGMGAWERRYWAEGMPVVAGTDEAGRGPLAGPVVAAAFTVLAHEDQEVMELLASVTDSKQMTAQDREVAFAKLTDLKFKGRTEWAIAEGTVSEIDDMNILQASLKAMSRAVSALERRPDCVLVDGCNRPPDLLRPGEQWTRGSRQAKPDVNQPKLSKFFAMAAPKAKPAESPSTEEQPWRPRHVEAVIKGDAKVPSIAAASVLAKVRRDAIMEELHKQFPQYGFDSHKGYGTEEHMEAIRAHGVCDHHRRSFGPVREVLGLPDSKPRQGSSGEVDLVSLLSRQSKDGDDGVELVHASPAEKSLAAETPQSSPAKKALAAETPTASPAEKPFAAETPKLRRRPSAAAVKSPDAETPKAQRGPSAATTDPSRSQATPKKRPRASTPAPPTQAPGTKESATGPAPVAAGAKRRPRGAKAGPS